ncbi:MAG: 5-demethoxyubiquinol-8 5-hydroxylase UbiM [Pseudomonadota bacterium]
MGSHIIKADIAVVGAGPAGLCFARNLAETGLNILLIEKQAEAQLEKPAYDGRETALTHSSRRILDELGIWDELAEHEFFPIKDARVLNGSSSYSLHFDHKEAGVDNLGFLVANSDIRRLAYQSIAPFENVSILPERSVHDVGSTRDHSWALLDDGTRIEAKLLLAADSRFSPTRDMLGLKFEKIDFDRVCIVSKMALRESHDATAYECFRDDETLAILPLNGNHVSSVLTVKTENAKAKLEADPADFAAEITQQFGARFGPMELVSPRFSYPLFATFAESFHRLRFAVIGDAAVGMNPGTAHGFNLGLLGTDILAQEIQRALARDLDFASHHVLSRYTEEHRRNCLPLYHGTNFLIQLYTNESTPAKAARHVMLRAANRIAPVRKLIMSTLTDQRN